MHSLLQVERLEVRILVDNVTDGLSTIPPSNQSEFGHLVQRGAAELSGDVLCCACHGFSALVTAHRGGKRQTILFDTGPEGYAFARNAERLGVELGLVDAVMLSHGHWDHAGGLLRALDLIVAGNGARPVPLYAHPGMFGSRAMRLPSGAVLPFQDVAPPATLAEHGAEVIAATGPQTALEGMFHVSGEIPRVTPFEKGFPGHLRRTADGTEWEPDPLIMDERSLWVHVAGKGLVILTACSHAGIVNVIQQARTELPDVPIHAVLGGFHLAGGTESIIPETVAALQAFGIPVLAPGHCTGWRAVTALAQAVGPTVLDPCAVGKKYTF